jgi:hypothetical protein
VGRRQVFFHARVCALLVVFAARILVAAPNPEAVLPRNEEIVRKSVEAIRADWAQAPKYTYLERDVDSKRNGPRLAKTYRVLMIDGSPYNLVTAMNDHPLSSDEKALEDRKLKREIEKRQRESAWQRQRRIAKYERERDHDHQMLNEMVNAFEFQLAGQAQVDGHHCWVMDAEPKPGYDPTDHEGRVLKEMKGRLWIDKATNQWVKVHAEVVRPVNFYGFLAKVGPGTEFDLEQQPLADGVWMPKVFNVNVHASALGFFSENSTENDSYADYQPMPQVSALLQSSQ